VLNHPYPYQKVHHSFPAKHTVDETSDQRSRKFLGRTQDYLEFEQCLVTTAQCEEVSFCSYKFLFCQKALTNNFFSFFAVFVLEIWRFSLTAIQNNSSQKEQSN
jgi:hypothetical protein